MENTTRSFDSPISKAIRYVGSAGIYEAVSNFQFALLQERASPDARVLEIGCGCLLLGHRAIDFLNDGNYVGIEPQTWLVEAGREFFAVTKPFRHVTNTNFDAEGGDFDLIYSHSVLSAIMHLTKPPAGVRLSA